MPTITLAPVWIAILSTPDGRTEDAEVLNARPQWDTAPTPDGETWHVAACEVANPATCPNGEVWFLITRDTTGRIVAVDACTYEPAFDLTSPAGHTSELRTGHINGGDSIDIPLPDTVTVL